MKSPLCNVFKLAHGNFTLVILFLLFSVSGYAQRTVTGKVKGNDTQQALIGVNVLVQGTTNGTITNSEGEFRIQINSPEDILVFSYIGYLSEQVKVGDQTNIELVMSLDITALDEVVMMGYSEKKKTEISSAVTVLERDKIMDVVSPNLGAMLQGKAAGVQVVNSSGLPGAGAEIRIRGTSTLNGSSDPLYVVDGIISGNSDPGIDPSLIESITILKDAGATGLYGARANGGVIIISTRKGSGKPEFEFSATFGRRSPDFGKLQMMNGSQYYDAHQGLFVDTTGYVDKVRFLSNYPKALRDRNFDWVNTIFQPAMMENYFLSASGGSEKYKYFLGTSYFNEKGTFMNTNFQKLSVRSNNTYNFSDRVNLAGNFDLNVSRGRGYDYMDMYYTYLASPWDSGYTSSGDPRYVDQTTTGWYSRDKINPIHSINNAEYGYKSASMNLNLGLNIKITSWMTFSSTLGLSAWNGLSTNIVSPLIAGPLHGIGSLTRTNSYGYGSSSTDLLKFSKSFGEHNLSGLIGGEFSYGYSDDWGGSAEGLMLGYTTFNTTARNFQVFGSYGEQSVESFLSQANYNFREKYFLTASFRSDANSKFAPNHKTAMFPSMSASWLLNKEDFMSSISSVDFLKLRFSYGYTGNEAISPERYNALYDLNSTYNGQKGAYPYQLPNMDLTWEKTRQMDLGIEAGINKRVNLTVDVYQNKTLDLLFIVQQAYSIGYETRWENSGVVTNKGVEFGISYDIIRTRDKSWVVDFNASLNNCEASDIERVLPRNLNGIEQRLENGKPLYAFYLPKWIGVNPNNGNPLWEKVVRDAQGKVISRTTTTDYKSAEKQYAGSAMPKYYGGFHSVWTYKSFSLSVNFSYVGGNKVYNNDRSQFYTDGAEPRMNFAVLSDEDVLWAKPGNAATLPRMGANSLSYYPSSRFLEKGDFIKFRNFTFSYTLPSKWFNEHIKNLTISFSGDNIYTFTKYTGMDPEATLHITDWSMAGVNDLKYPLNHQYNLTAKINF